MQIEGIREDKFTFPFLIKACTAVFGSDEAKKVHPRIIKLGFYADIYVCNALIIMYAKVLGIRPDRFSLVRVIGGCALEQNLLSGKEVFAQEIRNRLEFDSMIQSSLINMFGKCGENSYNIEAIETFKNLQNGPSVPDETTFASILPAYSEITLPKEGKVFDSMLFKDVVTWNTIIMAYGIHGFGVNSISLFIGMLNEGYEPNGSTFVSLLSSCSISGNWDEGRVGNFDRAKRFIGEMPLKPTSRIWGSLLAASRHYRNIEVAELAADHIFSLDIDNTGCYVLLSNMYADVEDWRKPIED
ncbi:hypothetical protein RD792_017747 [Penstemon davidsonii]|uniref:Pentatricopeptide repeat-containing protein n=1 Tax=Penstemon davidsonii TaxID=160366 RepID=A0ABR0DWP4_9LAMI|nr:hypothetical protein RD792_017747 [Penstemon davidsonii]